MGGPKEQLISQSGLFLEGLRDIQSKLSCPIHLDGKTRLIDQERPLRVLQGRGPVEPDDPGVHVLLGDDVTAHQEHRCRSAHSASVSALSKSLIKSKFKIGSTQNPKPQT